MKLIVGLGNYGNKYKNTRHNVGFLVLDKFLGNINWKETDYGFYFKSEDTIYLKPTTYMNLSGKAVTYFVNYFKINKEDLLIIYDDVDIELGNLKIKSKGSSGGHNGIKSIIESLNTDEFLRLKVGISKNKKIDTSKYVLGKFSSEEKAIISTLTHKTNNIIIDFTNNKNPEYLMNKYN